VIGFVRSVNTAEAAYRLNPRSGNGSGTRGRYASWAELRDSGVLEQYAKECPMARVDWARQAADGKGIDGYRVDLIVATDGMSYSFAVHDQREGHRLFSVFSDQTGIIYWGEPLQ
jgi:hypothetical protein